MNHDPTRHSISCEIDRKVFKGNYWIARRILVVSIGKGGKSTRFGVQVPQTLAEELLLYPVKEGKA